MPDRTLRANARRYLRAGVGVAASAICLYLALRNVSFNAVAQALAGMDLRYGSLAFASVAANTLAKTYRWQVLLGPAGRKIPFGKLVMAILAGQALNTLIPVRVGDITRVVAVGRLGSGYFFTLGTLLVEKMADGLAYLLLFVVLIVQIPLPAGGSGPGLYFLLSVILAACVVFFLAYRQEWLLTWSDWLVGRFRSKLGGFTIDRLREAISGTEALKSRKSVTQLILWLGLAWGTALLNVWLVLAAMQIQVPWTASLALVVLLQAGISIPSIPGRVGVFEYICVLTLAAFGVSQATALAFGVALHIVVLLPTTLLGLLFLSMLGLGGKIEPGILTGESPSAEGEPSTGKP